MITYDEIKELAWKAGGTIRHTAGLFELSDYRAAHFGFSLEALTKFSELILARAWQPIETVQEGQHAICMWLNSDGEPCYYFDYFEDGAWQNYFNEHEHYLIAGAAKGRSEDAPYTHWMPMPSIEAAMIATAQKGSL